MVWNDLSTATGSKMKSRIPSTYRGSHYSTVLTFCIVVQSDAGTPVLGWNSIREIYLRPLAEPFVVAALRFKRSGFIWSQPSEFNCEIIGCAFSKIAYRILQPISIQRPERYSHPGTITGECTRALRKHN